MMKAKKGTIARPGASGYGAVLADVVRLIETARGAAARSVNAVMTATYWAIGRRIVEHEQGGAARAAYGEELLKSLAGDLTAKLGRGFSERNLEQMRRFFLTWSISQTASAKSLPTPDFYAIGGAKACLRSRIRPSFGYRASRRLYPARLEDAGHFPPIVFWHLTGSRRLRERM